MMDIHALYQLYLRHPRITTDSRDCPPGSIFIALRGESFDGNQYAAAALDKGCAYAVVSDRSVVRDDRYLLVDDTLQTFKDLAREHRRQFHIPVIGITGTNGKTTTKELVAAVLSRRYRVLYTQGNFNNDVGVPKTLFRLTPDHDVAVVEMGASHPGDIKTLVETAEPTCGLITNVGRAHLAGFGSFEGVKRTKGELYDYLQAHDALVFVNADNADLMAMVAERGIGRVVSYGQAGDTLVQGQVMGCAPYLHFWWQAGDEAPRHEVQTQLVGTYNLDNMLAAIAVGRHFGVAPADIDQALHDYVPQNNRSQLTLTEHNRLVVDAYNANPTSMAAALDNFARMEVAPKMAILGQMGELGDVSDEEHRRVVEQLRQAGFEQVWLVGEAYAGIPCDYRKFRDVDEVRQAIADQQPRGYYILIKGSNAVRLWQLPELL